jgi:HK97 family phage major capsid protein
MMGGKSMQRATYQVGSPAVGGNLVETDLLAESFIEVLRNQSIVARLGARFLTGLIGNVDIPRRSSATQTYWVGESVAVTESEATFDKVSLRPKTLGALSRMSRLALMQTTPAIEMLTRFDMAQQMALGMDLAALSGSGTGGVPTGITNQAGVGSVVGGTNGAPISFDYLIQMYSQINVANAPQDALSFAFNAKVRGYLATIKATTGQYLWNPNGNMGESFTKDIQGYDYAMSNQLRYTLTKGTSTGVCSELIFGNWSELLIGEWGVMEVLVNPYENGAYEAGDVLIRALQTCDVQLRHGASFSVMSDATTPGF